MTVAEMRAFCAALLRISELAYKNQLDIINNYEIDKIEMRQNIELSIKQLELVGFESE